MMAKRIFILGLQRSGTTWLANMLAALPQVAAVAHEDHRGVHESVFFSHFARGFGPWQDADARKAFCEAFAASDYYQLTEHEPELLPELVDSSDDYGDVFVRVMDLYAAVEGAEAWLEKSPHHTLMARQLLRAAPDAHLVMVARRTQDLILSRLYGFGRTPQAGIKRKLDVLRGSLTAALYRREMRRLAASENALFVTYEALKNDPDHATRKTILSFLEIEADPAQMESTYSANTSHTNDEARQLSLDELCIMYLGLGLARLVPLSALKAVQRRRAHLRGVDWPDWVWTMTSYDPTVSDPSELSDKD
ncbi:sulfotransferase family protein [Pseudooctadecabacter jejudonensis]|uniref:Sulfotransferase domain protein n=1 Tax=Pseudooctadecabacter jejudonensis TaxID=1391910 RepID=A0A1Y5SSE6_9RHOB|nr:sulfotransferase [Pseudooctadecabacter jejudonensis]SLN45904.1 Sulfotransferase domain protein [Pseudooctadecabacter jejudonensis]